MPNNPQVGARNYAPTDSKPGINIIESINGKWQATWTPYLGGEKSSGVMECWSIASHGFEKVLHSRFSGLAAGHSQGMVFCHVTPTKWVAGGFADAAARSTGEDKEYGEGFYTMCGLTLAKNGDAYVLGDEWFRKKQSQPKWSVLVFALPAPISSWFLEVAGGFYRNQLLHYLTQPTSYPSGSSTPTAGDISGIEAINKLGKALIFPNDPSIEVEVGASKKFCAAAIQENQGANLPGMPWVVIGPQKPEYLTARQIAWKAPQGMWMINSSTRTLAYNSKL